MSSIPADNFKLLFDQLPGLYLILSHDFTITAASDLYLEASLTTRASIIGRNIFEAFPDNPDDPKADGVLNLRASLNYVLQNKQPHAMADQKYDIRRPDGVFEERYWSPLNTPVFNEQHEICYIIHRVQDVTASRIATNQLKKNKRDFQLLVNSVKDYAIFMLDKKGCVSSWNSGAEYIKGYTAAEIMGKPLNIFYTAEDIANGVPQNNLQKALQNGHCETEGWRKRKDGSLFFANIVFTALVDTNGSHYGYAKVTKDITQKRKDEERIRFLASITNNIQDPVISSDNNFCITRWNDAAEKLFGWKNEEVIGKTTTEIFKTIYLYQAKEQVLATIAEKGIWQGELIYHSKSGSPVNVIATASKLKDAEGNESGNLILVRNITDRKIAEEALSTLNKELECKVAERTEAIKRSEKQYRNLFENNPMPMWVMEMASFKILDVNEMAVLQYGYSREEFLSMTALDIRPDSDKDKFIHSDHADDITVNNYNKGIWNHKKKNGSIIQVEVVVHDITFQGVAARIILASDITEKKKAEEKLLASEKLYRALIENSNDIISLMDSSFKLVYRSPAAVRLIGWTNEDMLGVDATKNIHAEDKAMAADIAKEVMANPNKTVHAKFRMQHKQGHYLWLEGTFTNLLQDNYVKAIVFNFRDVTERIDAEEKLIASEQRFRALIENNNDLIVLLDDAFNIVYRSPSAARITGWTNDDMVGVDATKDIFEEERPLAVAILQEALANPGKPIHCKFRMWHKQGHYLWVEGVLINLLQDKYVNGIVINFRDVTERMEAEEKLMASEKRFRALIENSNDLIIMLDDTFAVLYRSPSAARITGWQDEEITGFSCAKNMHPDDIEKAITLLKDVKANPGKPIYGKFRNKHKNGHYQWMEGVAINLLHEKDVKAIVFNSRDITERIKAETQLQKSFSENQALAKRMSVILNTLPANIALLNEEGLIIDVNDAWRRFAAENEFAGTNYGIGDNYITIAENASGNEETDGNKVAAGLKAVLTNKIKEFVYEYPCHSPQKERWFRMVVSPLQEKEYAGAVIMHVDISELRMLEQARLKSSMDEQKKITLAILQGQEKERNYIGKELHDNVNQILAGAKMFLSSAGNKNEMIKELVQYPLDLISTSIEEVRMLCRNLVSPLKNIDLEDLARGLLTNYDKSATTKTAFTYTVPKQLLSDDLKLNSYRILQELINNTLKYAEAKTVSVSLKAKGKTLIIIVADDGKGFDLGKKRQGIGISNIINRVESFNGFLDIKTSPGRGCKTIITIPANSYI